MANRVIASAPAKLMLFGEHAVVYGFPCVVTSVSQRMKVEVGFNGKGSIVVRAPQVGLDHYHKKIVDLGKQRVPKPVRFIEVLVKNLYEKYELEGGLDITTSCDFSSSFGFGSSAAVTVALAEAVNKLYNLKIGKNGLFNICYKTVLDVQGVGSGFDIAAAIDGGLIYFVGGGKVIEKINTKRLSLVVGYTGVKADTPTLVRQVTELRRRETKKLERVFSKISDIVEKARIALEESDYELLGKLMNKNQRLLTALSVSSKELDKLIAVANNNGALGAKLSGAGGGDCMIALVDEKKRDSVGKALEKVGGKVLKVELGGAGVRVELR